MLFLDVEVDVALWLVYTIVIQSLSTTVRYVALKAPQEIKKSWSTCHSLDHKHWMEGLRYSLIRKKNNIWFSEKIKTRIFWWHVLLISVKSLIFSQNLECFKHALDSPIMFLVYRAGKCRFSNLSGR